MKNKLITKIYCPWAYGETVHGLNAISPAISGEMQIRCVILFHDVCKTFGSSITVNGNPPLLFILDLYPAPVKSLCV
jgi:hypothetical protein